MFAFCSRVAATFPRLQRMPLAPGLLVAWLLCTVTAIQAGSGEWTAQQDDLRVTVDTRWCGGGSGGYYPIRVRLTNTARKRAVTLRFSGHSEGREGGRLPDVERQVVIDQNATVHATLSVPMVSGAANGDFSILDGRGARIDGLSKRSINLSDRDYGVQRPSLLVISPDNVDCSGFEKGVSIYLANASRHSSMSRSEDHVVLAPTMLPENWIDYTAVDLIAVKLAVFEKLPQAVRTALLQWTEAGGHLLVTSVGKPAAESEDLKRLLELSNRRAISPAWRQPDLKNRALVNENNMMAENGIVIVDNQQVALTTQDSAEVWQGGSAAFAERTLVVGHVYAFSDEPFPGSARDWVWWLRSLDSRSWEWTTRHGLSTREVHPEFQYFLIPGMGDPPKIAFLVLISLFAIVIGPVNYFLLARRKQLYMLVVTIPLIAFLTSSALFAYAVIADGFGVLSRVRSVTVIDQDHKTATAWSRISMYAGLAPSAGLTFAPETAVLPLWSNDAGLESGAVDWTRTQHLPYGFMRSRLHSQFATITQRPERGRLEIRTSADGAMEASNGLTWSLSMLLAKDKDGNVFFAPAVPAGGNARLTPISTEQLRALRTLLDDRAPAPPATYDGSYESYESYRSYRGYPYNQEQRSPSRFGSNAMEQFLLLMLDPAAESPKGMPRQSYMAIADSNPGIELGVSAKASAKDLHVIVGFGAF